MASSKNRRKNGKVVKHNQAKRVKSLATHDLQDLMVCNVVDTVELKGKQGSEMIPRTVVFNRRLNKIVPITKAQEYALKQERWAWNIQMGIVCRRQDGEVYLDKETNLQLSTEVLLPEMNDCVVDHLLELWGTVNSLHALTMYWVACPYNIDKRGMEGIPLDAALAPLWAYNVLGNVLTQYEQDNPDLTVVHFRTDRLSEYVKWFLSQQQYRNELAELREVTYWFETSGKKMEKGELMAFRDRLIKQGKIDRVGFAYEKFNPFATPEGFVKWGKHTATMDSYKSSVLMGAFDNVPACINVYVEIKKKDGEVTKVKLYHEGTTKTEYI